MTEGHLCAGVVEPRGDYFVRMRPCRNNGRTFEDGEWWCKRHLPSDVLARQNKRNSRDYFAAVEENRERDIAARAKQWMEVGPKLLDALVKSRATLKEVCEDCYGSYHGSGRLDDAIKEAEEIK